ncbi:MAG: helix-turn-helix domain-containing protein [Rubrobacter sp.]|nr:helix-turn-helix domain-containing protein [Rubrobacter sp.]
MGGRKPDYEMEEVLKVTEPGQFRAAGDATRQKIITLLSEKAATTSQLSEALGQPKGSVGHHLKVLEEAALIRVVKTRKVRAMTEKYYGRTARLFDFHDPEGYVSGVRNFYQTVMAEYREPNPESDFPDDILTLGRARISASRAAEFGGRVEALVEEFRNEESVPGEEVYGFLAQVYLTNLPALPDEEE